MRTSTKRTGASLFLFLAVAGLGPRALAQPSGPGAGAPKATGVDHGKTEAPAPAAPAAPAKPEDAAKTRGIAATVVALKTIEGVMGKSVRSRTGNEDMGRIVDVLVDANGQVRAAVIDFGGFLGVGSRNVAVAWKTLDFTDSIAAGSAKVTLTRDEIRQAPEYKADEPIVILDGGAAAEAGSGGFICRT